MIVTGLALKTELLQSAKNVMGLDKSGLGNKLAHSSRIQYDHAQIVKVQVGNSLTGVKPALEMEGYQSLKC